ncbi:MAG: ABC transporter substrate-binding protein [Acidobacteriota bacterium]
MRYALKRLLLGFVLIAGGSAVLLVSDLQHRKRPRRVPRIATFQYSTRPIMDSVVRGVLDALSDAGFVDGKTINIQKFNAENDLPTANSVARAIVDARFDMVVTASTPCLQTMASVNRSGQLLHVFCAVTDPFAAGVGVERDDPLDHPRHLVGVGTFQPVKEVFRLVKRCNPELSVVGVVWNPAEACSEACTVLAREVCGELGITLVEANVDSSSQVGEAAHSLVSRDAQALWLGGDNTVEVAIGQLVETARSAGIPLLTNAPANAEAGASLSLGADYYQVGRAAGDLAARLLNGLDPATVRIENMVPQQLGLNLLALRNLRGPWRTPPELVDAAALVIDESGARRENTDPSLPQRLLALTLPAASELPLAARGSSGPSPGRAWRLRFVNFVESPFVEDVHRGFFDELKKMGRIQGRDFEIEVACAQGDMASLPALLTDAKDAEPDVILTTSTPTLQAAIRTVDSTPVLFAAVADAVLAGAGKTRIDHKPNVTGIETAADFPLMMKVIKQCIPHARRIGTLFAPAEINSAIYKDILAEASLSAGMELVALPTATSTDVPDTALSLASKDIDAICQILDNLHDMSFAAIARAAEKTKKPLFAFLSQQVVSGGAAVAVSADFEQAGRDLAHLLDRVMHGDSPSGIPFQRVSRTLLVANPKNAAQCGLTIPPAVMKSADVVVGR